MAALAHSPDERAVAAEPLAPYAHLVERLSSGAAAEEAISRIVDAAVEVWERPGFDTFASLEHLRFEPFDYQLETAEVVLRRMRGRAILADEVGLGKTIEAGLVLTELRLRGLARRVLVVCPAGLVAQWHEELERKFALPTNVLESHEPEPAVAGSDPPVAICSLPTARRSPMRDRLVDQDWDLVVIDEAHRAKNPSTASSRLVRDLRARHLLLLTATPVENRLADLFNLASLVAPGVLGTAKQFRSRHGGDASATPRELSALRARMREVMVRHRRSQVALMLPRRLAETLVVTPGDAERDLYATVAELARSEGRSASQARAMALRSALRLAGSSPAAVRGVAAKLGWRDVEDRVEELLATRHRSAKADVLLDVLARLGATWPRAATRDLRDPEDGGGAAEKVIVFTAYRRTQEHLAQVLNGAGVSHVLYHGALSRREKEAAVGAFRSEVPVLLSTEAAGEGRNLQFCHQMVNFDLPWNPMQIEQRLGRLHRIGQDHDVVVVNLVARGTIEERVLSVLESKINLFELVVGELDMILGRVEDDYDFERVVFDAHVQSRDMDELGHRLGEVGDHLARARQEYLRTRERIDSLVGGEEDGTEP